MQLILKVRRYIDIYHAGTTGSCQDNNIINYNPFLTRDITRDILVDSSNTLSKVNFEVIPLMILL